MRRIGWLLLALMAVGWIAAEYPLPGAANPDPPMTSWRRTVHGWERADRWTLESQIRRPALHPLVVGLLEALLGLGVLVAFSSDKTPRRSPKPRLPEGTRRTSLVGPNRFLVSQPRHLSRPPGAGRIS